MSPSPRVPRPQALLVDDDVLIHRVARRALARLGWDVTAVGSLAQAEAQLLVRRFEVAILDYFLADGECGCDVIPSLRAHNPSIRIAVLTGLGALVDIVRHAHDAGAHLVASKTQIDWASLVRASAPRPAPARRTRTCTRIDLGALRREVIHGTFLVYHRNVSLTARALGMSRSGLQRILRKAPPPDLRDVTGPFDDE